MLGRLLNYCSDRLWSFFFRVFGGNRRLRDQFFQRLPESQNRYQNYALVLLSDGCDAQEVRACLLEGASNGLIELGMGEDQQVRDALRETINDAVDAAALEMYSHHLTRNC